MKKPLMILNTESDKPTLEALQRVSEPPEPKDRVTLSDVLEIAVFFATLLALIIVAMLF